VAIPSIIRGVIHSMFMTKLWQAASVLFVAAALVGAGGAVLANRGGGVGSATEQETQANDGSGAFTQDAKSRSEKEDNRAGDRPQTKRQPSSQDWSELEARRQEWMHRFREYVAGTGTLDFLIQSSSQVCQVELRIAQSQGERILALSEELQRALAIWEVNRERYVAGKVVTQDLAQTRGYYESVREKRLQEIGLAVDQSRSAQEATVKPEPKLGVELVDVASRAWISRKSEFDEGRGSLAQLLISSKRLRDAQLRTRVSGAERTTALKAHVDRVRRIEETVERWFKAGRAADIDFYETRYARIDAELDLEQATPK
jgi:hypothetical protein